MGFLDNLTGFEMSGSNIALRIMRLIRQTTDEKFCVTDMGGGEYKIIIDTAFFPCVLTSKWNAEDEGFEIIDAAMYARICDAKDIEDSHPEIFDEISSSIPLENFMTQYRQAIIWSEEEFRRMIVCAINCTETQYRYLYDSDTDPVYSCGIV